MAYNSVGIFANEHGLINENTLRFIHLGYPILQVRANILSLKDSPTFNLMKKYIYRLVSGDDPDCKNPMAYVDNRLEAFQLLGIDKELYDVASYCYDELILEGKIHDSEMGPLAVAAKENDPTLKRIRTSRQRESLLLIDPFSTTIYAANKFPTPKAKDEILRNNNDICLPTLPEYVTHLETLEALINQQNFSFEDCTEEFMTARLQEQFMPSGTKSIELLSDEAYPKTYWLAYYLALQKTEDGETFYLYNPTNGKIINTFPINDAEHREFRDFFKNLFYSTAKQKVEYSLTRDVDFELKDENGCLNPEINLDENGNYIVTLTDNELATILSTDEDEAVEALKILLYGTTVITNNEAGRLIHFILTDEQKEMCQNKLSDFSEPF